jgi:hypothetical protein
VAQRAGTPYPKRANIHEFFQLFTLAWAVYFFIKAGFYLAVGQILPPASATAERLVAGGVSLGMMVVSARPKAAAFCNRDRLGLLPKAETA